MPSITINFTAEQGTRLSVAMQEALVLDAPATLADVKGYIINDLKQVVRSAESRIAYRAVAPDPTDIDLT